MNREVYDAIVDLVALYGHGPFDVRGVNTCGVSRKVHAVFSMWFKLENLTVMKAGRERHYKLGRYH